MSLASGEDMTVEMTLTLPGRPNGGAFENCAALALPDDPLLRNKIVQSLLNDMGIDVGTVDGVVGPNTRAGILQLEQQENWPQTGEVTVALLAALGLNATSGQTCVTVALSPMPAPPLVCDPSTTVLIDGSCECRFSRMMQTNPSSCTCISGTQLQAGQGCVRPQRQTSTPSTPRPTVDTPNCPAGSTYNAARRACIAPAPAPQRCRLPNQTLVNGECTCNPGFVRAGFHCNRPSTDSDSQGPIP